MASDPRAAKLRQKLLEDGRSVTWLAEQMDLSRPYVSAVLAGTRPWTPFFADQAMKVLGESGIVRDHYRGRVVKLPASIYRAASQMAPDIVAQTYEDAWKQSWIAEHGPEALAVAAERAFRQAVAA